MKNKFLNKHITIVGLGLIGGSLAMVLKERGFTNIVGFSKSRKTMHKAQALGAIDKAAFSLSEAVKDTDMVIICTPILEIEHVLAGIKNHLKDGCIVTDVGSTKEIVMGCAEKILPQHVFFLGGHPMTGKETSGIEHADRTLFQNCTWCLTPSRLSSTDVVNAMKEFVRFIGAKPLVLGAEIHDEAAASISHLSFLLSVMLMNIVCKKDNWNIAQKLASSGFRDTSRLASGNIEMYVDICQTNKDNITSLINKISEEVKDVREALQTGKKERLTQLFTKAKEERVNWFVKSRFNKGVI